MTPTPTPVDPPEEPTTWTPETVITYVASLAVFVIGLLTLSGVTIPKSVAPDIQLWAGAATSTIGGIISLGVFIWKTSLKKTAIAAGWAPALAQKL